MEKRLTVKVAKNSDGVTRNAAKLCKPRRPNGATHRVERTTTSSLGYVGETMLHDGAP